MAFEPELTFQRVEDGLDPLPDAAEFPEPGFLFCVVGADQERAEIVGDERLELYPDEARVSADRLPGLDEMVVPARWAGTGK